MDEDTRKYKTALEIVEQYKGLTEEQRQQLRREAPETTRPFLDAVDRIVAK